jgi:hypothetical protein
MDSTPAPKGWRNPVIIAAIIAAIATMTVALIGLIPKPKPQEPTHIEQPASGSTPNVEANGGVAVGRDMHGNTITITGPDQKTTLPEKPKGN